MDHLRSHSAETTLSAPDLRALQALAEPNRARIVELLGHGEHCVCDVGGALGLSTALVSHHLRVLRESGLVNERRDGRWVHYALDVERLARLRTALETLLTPGEAALLACPSSGCGLLSRGRDGMTPKPLEAASSRR
jgi:ArsR family transcriptional regulator